MLTISERERRTLLAALACWLNERGYHDTEELQHYYPDLGADPLTIEEVDRLIVRVMHVWTTE